MDGSGASSIKGRVFFKEKCGLKDVRNTIVMQCNSRHEIPSPVLSLISSPSFIPGTLNFPIFFKTEIIKSKISNVIDLRYPDVQKWMYESLLNGIKNVIYLYSNEPSFSAFHPKLISDKLIDKSAANSMMAVHPPNEDWDGKKVYYSNMLLDLLSILMYSSTMGGTPLTNAIGRWLQSIGTNALIYPSARTNVMCNVEGNLISDFAGFVLVDYRDKVDIPYQLTTISEPDSWKERWLFDKNSNIAKYNNSWMLSGITETLIKIKNHDLNEYYKSHGIYLT